MPLVRAVPPELRHVDINGLALNTTLYYAADLSHTALDISLSSALFGMSPHTPPQCVGFAAQIITGVLTLLVLVAITFLM